MCKYYRNSKPFMKATTMRAYTNPDIYNLISMVDQVCANLYSFICECRYSLYVKEKKNILLENRLWTCQ